LQWVAVTLLASYLPVDAIIWQRRHDQRNQGTG
jgi:hypothetical protein